MRGPPRRPPPRHRGPHPIRHRAPSRFRHRGPPPPRHPVSFAGSHSSHYGGGDNEKTLKYIGYAFVAALALLIIAGFSVAVAGGVTFGPGSKVEIIAASEPGIKEYALNALIITIIGGLLLIAIAALGIFAWYKMKNTVLIVFIVIMLIFFIILLIMGVYAILMGTGNVEDAETVLKIKVSMSRYGKPEYQKFWNSTQHQYKCCGIIGEDAVQDWFEALNTVKRIPRSCLKNIKRYPKDIPQKEWNASKPKPKLWGTGCYEKFLGKMVQVGGICIGFTLLMLACVSFACVLILLP